MKLDFSKIRSHTIRGRAYQMFWRRPPRGPGKKPGGCVGLCDAPETARKRIYVSPNQSPEEILATVIHECMGHGMNFDLAEEAISDAERDTMRLLRRMGMRVSFEPQ